MNRTDLQQLAEERLEDARVLFQHGRYAAAYYLCGYAVECGLKACIARLINQDEFPPYANFSRDVYTHDLNRLVVLAQLSQSLATRKLSSDDFEENWSEVEQWTEQSRYDTKTMQEAQRLLGAIDDAEHGVLGWIRLHW